MQALRLEGRPVSEDALRIELAAMRHFLLPVWGDWLKTFHAHASVDDNVERVSLFTASFLTKALGPGWACAGGTPMAFHPLTFAMENSSEGGFRSFSGWHPHWWVTCKGWIADITSSEIGGEPVVLTSTDDPRYRGTLSDNEIGLGKKIARERALAWYRHWMATEAQRVLALRPR